MFLHTVRTRLVVFSVRVSQATKATVSLAEVNERIAIVTILGK